MKGFVGRCAARRKAQMLGNTTDPTAHTYTHNPPNSRCVFVSFLFTFRFAVVPFGRFAVSFHRDIAPSLLDDDGSGSELYVQFGDTERNLSQ